MTTVKVPHDWSEDLLLNKAQQYAAVMHTQDRMDWQFAFWSALTLELLVRASLSNVSPTLVADGSDWNNIYYALGETPNKPKFSPKSASISELLKRVENIFPDFTREMLNFSTTHLNRRNSELHTGALPFHELGTSQWLPMFYSCCKVLLDTLDQTMEFLFGVDEAATAGTLIEALKDDAAKAVGQTINAHRTIWEEKDQIEREKLSKQAETLSTRHIGHRASCPSCNSVAILHGSPTGAPSQSFDNDIVIEKQPMLPTHFECMACGLKIVGYSKLNACGLGDSYTSTSNYDAAEYFGIEPSDEWYGMDEDNNEPY